MAQVFRCAGVDHLYSWQGRTSEVEFLRQINSDILPIEVKSGWVTQAKSLRVFADKYKPPYRTILSGKKLTIDTENLVHNYPLYLTHRFPLNTKVSG